MAEVWVGANFLFGHDRCRQLLAAAQRSARATASSAEKIDPVRYKDFVVSSTRIRRVWSAKGASTRPARCSAPVSFLDRHGGARRRSAAAPSASRPPISAPRTSCCRRTGLCDDGADCRHRARVGDQRRAPARRSTPPGPHRRSRHTSSTSIAISTAQSMRVGFVQRLRDERAVRVAWTRCAPRSRPIASARVLFTAFHCRIASAVPDQEFLFALDAVRWARVTTASLAELTLQPSSGTRRLAASPATIDDAHRPARSAAPTGARDRARRRCGCGSVRAPASSRSWSPVRRRRGVAHHLVLCRLPDPDASLQHPDPQRRGLRPGRRQHRPDVTCGLTIVRAWAHRQLPHVHLRRRAAPDAEVPARLPGASR